MPNVKQKQSRNKTPPDVARRYGVATAKVIGWIRTGELKAINVANRGCSKPRFSISPEALEEFERSREVVPAGDKVLRLRRKSTDTKDFFPD